MKHLRPSEEKMRQVGSGNFTKAYERPDGYIELHSIDPVKEFMATIGFPDHPMFPKCEKIGTKGKDTSIYIMKKLTIISESSQKLNRRQQALLDALDNLRAYTAKDLAKEFATLPDRFRVERELLIEATKSMGKVKALDGISWDMCDFNLAISKSGRLILLDCFYPKETSNRFGGSGFSDSE